MGWDQVVVSPLGFTSDHIETLHELDIEMMEDAEPFAYKKLHRAPSLNDHPLFIRALADIVGNSLDGAGPTKNMGLRCPDCRNPNLCIGINEAFTSNNI